MTDNSLMMAYDNASEKLQKLLDDNNWDIEVQCKHYPVTYTYRKAQMPIGSDNPKAPEIKFIFRADVEYVFSVPEDERVDETFFQQIEEFDQRSTPPVYPAVVCAEKRPVYTMLGADLDQSK